LARTRVAISATAPCADDVVEYWRSLGVPLRQAYSLTEAAGFAAVAGTDDPAGSVGHAVGGIEIDVGSRQDAEVVLRCGTRFGDSSFHTGDVGTLAEGVLTLTGRTKETIVTSGGSRVAPRAIEATLEESPYVRAAVIVGDGRPCLGVAIVIDATTVGDWAAERGASFTTFATLSALPEVRDLVGEVVEATNAGLDERDRIGCFAVLSQELGHDEELVTDTHKLRRGPIATRFADVIERMYSERGTGGAS
jgi:long-chain acyl-CoA synthetase